MALKTYQDGLATLLYHDELWDDHKARNKSFDFDRRQAKGARSLGNGRGSALLWTRKDGSQWVLRHYRRGGAIARLSPDRYVWNGLARTRAWREFHLLHALHAEGLLVPRPVAARIVRKGLFYRQDLITERVADATPLSDLLCRTALGLADWHTLGATLRRFHDAGVGHADLNAANILRREDSVFFLIDFDRGRRPAGPAFQARSIARLRRSLLKGCRIAPGFHFTESDWAALLAGLSGHA